MKEIAHVTPSEIPAHHPRARCLGRRSRARADERAPPTRRKRLPRRRRTCSRPRRRPSPPPSPLPLPRSRHRAVPPPPVVVNGARTPEGHLQPRRRSRPRPTVETSWFTRTPLKVPSAPAPRRGRSRSSARSRPTTSPTATRSYNDYIGQHARRAHATRYEGTGRAHAVLDAEHARRVPARFAGHRQLGPVGGVPGGLRRQSAGVPYVPPGSPGSAGISESAYYNSPTFRVRHAYLTLRNPVVDILAGQTFDVFGWQNYYAPCALLGPPEPDRRRAPRSSGLSRSFGAGGPVVVDVALEAARPGQRDSQIPDIEGGRAPQPPRLEGDHDAGQRGDDRGAVLDRRLGHHPPVQGQRLHAAAGADVEQRDGLGRIGRPLHPRHPGRRASTIAATG